MLWGAGESVKLILEKAYSARGSDMGRRDIMPADLRQPIKLQMERLRWVDGDYDQGGAYWGGGNGDDIYCAFTEEVRIYVRAVSREHAKAEVRLQLPAARFYR